MKPTAPFAFDATFYKPDHFTSGDNFWQPGVRWQTWAWKGQCLGLKFENRGRVNTPKINLHVYSKGSLTKELLDSLIDEISWRYNLNLDLSDFYQQFGRHELLGSIIKRWRGLRPGQPSSLYEYLIIGVVLQNAAVRRSAQMFKALLENYGTEIEFDGKKLWCFWEPGRLEGVTIDNLRALKVGYRAKYIKNIDDQFSQGVVDETRLRNQDLETQREALLGIYGVGPATVWYILADVFHQWEYFAHVSPWEQKIYSKLFFDHETTDPVPVEKILKYIDQFGKYKHLAVHYIWEDLFWERKTQHIPWLEKEIRL